MNMIRTTFLLPPTLHFRLQQKAKDENKKIAQVVREVLDSVLKKEEAKQRKQMYKQLQKLEGIFKDANLPPTLSQDIDEILYGENGAWRGSDVK